MAILLEIRKKSEKNFWHYYIDLPKPYASSDYSIDYELNQITLTKRNGAFIFLRNGFDVNEIAVYDDSTGGSIELFTSGVSLAERLVELGYNAYFQDGDVNLSGLQSKPTVTADTGAVVSLANSGGNLCNMASANSNTSYTTENESNGGNATILVNALSEPTVTGSTKIKGSDFTPSIEMYLKVWYNSNEVQHWFEEI